MVVSAQAARLADVLDTAREHGAALTLTRAAQREAYLETLDSVADQVGEFELTVARMANDPAMDIADAPELLARAGNHLGDVREMLRKARRDVIEH